MIVVQLDVALLAVPNYARSAEEAEELFSRLLYWLRVQQSGAPITFARSDGALDALAAANCFPTRQDVEAFLNQFGLSDAFGVADVWTAYLTLLERAVPAGDVSGVEVVSCSTTEAPHVSELFPSELRPQTMLTYANVWLQRAIEGSRLWYVGAAVPSVGVDAIEGEISECLGASASLQPLPIRLSGSVAGIRQLEDVLTSDDPLEFWNRARTNADLHLCVALNILALEATGVSKLCDISDFVVGSAFFESLSLRQCGPGGRYAGRALDACSRVVAGVPKHPVRAFGQPSQIFRERDGGKAFRSHITKKGAALRLMLWQANARLELANVGRKNELRIEAGSSTGAFSVEYPAYG